MLRQSPTNPCLLETSVDGVTWCVWADISKCIQDFQGQPTTGGAGQPAAGACVTYDAVLQGNGKWLVPIQVSAGNTIAVTQIDGGWNDGTAGWFCGTGHDYVLGLCDPSAGYNGADPLPTAYHMAIVVDINGTFYDPTVGPITVPNGVTTVNAVFQANDSSLSDNAGSVKFHVEVCNLSVTEVTFTSLNGNTLPVPNPAHVGDTFTWPIDADSHGFYYSDLSLTPCATVEVLLNNQTNTGGGAGISDYHCSGGSTAHAQGFTGTLPDATRIIYQTQDQSQGTPLVSIRVVSIP